MKQLGLGISHGKVILMGEHAVVYGKPALALPFKGAQATATFKQRETGQMIHTPFYNGPCLEAVVELEGIVHMTRALLASFDLTNLAFELSIDSSIPIQRGLGSSAAVSTAVVKAFYDFIGEILSFDAMMDFVTIAETHHHGKASGIDSWVIGTDRPILFRKDFMPEFLTLPSGFLVVVDTEVLGLTKEAVSKVRASYEQEPEAVQLIFDDIEKLTYETQKALHDNMLHIVGANMTQVHQYLRRLGVSTAQLDLTVEVALRHGALGAKLTGAGLGGCMIALFENRSAAAPFVNTISSPYWAFEIGSDFIG